MPKEFPSLLPSKRATRRVPGCWAVVAGLLAWNGVAAPGRAQESGENTGTPPASQEDTAAAPERRLFIKQYRVVGTRHLPREDVEMAVYSYLGPERTADDVEGARAALEQRYKDKGYQTVTVSVPAQRGKNGIIVLKVTEAPVGRLRVRGARYFDIEKIRRAAPSLAEGTVPDFEAVQRDIVALNQRGDLRVTPELKPGAVPGTVDVDLVVKDTFPLHGSVELNNRYSANTTPLRLDLGIRYDNLWQIGHTIGFGFQIAPQRPSDALVFSGYYIAPVPGVDWLSVMFQGIRQNSDVSTLGGTAVAGNGVIIGGRLLFELPGGPGFFQSASFGIDYKDFAQDLTIGGEVVQSPITYWPFVASYTGLWMGKGWDLQFDGAVTFHFRGMGSNEIEFDNRRYSANGNFLYFRGTLGYTRELPAGFEAFAQIQGQASSTALVDSEQFSMGGLNTVRGYLESEVLGDSAVVGTAELRTPSLLNWMKGSGNEWRFFAFVDGGSAYLNEALPEQTSQFNLWSFGVGSTMKLGNHLNGSLVMGVPQVTQSPTSAGQPLLTFRVWGEL